MVILLRHMKDAINEILNGMAQRGFIHEFYNFL